LLPNKWTLCKGGGCGPMGGGGDGVPSPQPAMSIFPHNYLITAQMLMHIEYTRQY
jgi:hypothetical protein